MIADYINGVLYELENGETSKQTSSKDDWDSAITFTARISGKRPDWLDPSASQVYKLISCFLFAKFRIYKSTRKILIEDHPFR